MANEKSNSNANQNAAAPAAGGPAGPNPPARDKHGPIPRSQLNAQTLAGQGIVFVEDPQNNRIHGYDTLATDPALLCPVPIHGTTWTRHGETVPAAPLWTRLCPICFPPN